ncbi:MAG TPA: DUF1801 domain-containing protein [Chitinolyticbacter sp.]|nr:DUF1801 domain-containing protein [Chitinolyticbacter sp.]
MPNVQKAVRWNTPFYGIAGEGWFLAYHCLSKYVKVAFLNGTLLQPVPPIASRHEGTRYMHLHEGDQLDEALLLSWIRQAAAVPGERCF